MEIFIDLYKPFIAGVLVLLSPCVFPLLPVYMTILSEEGEKFHSRVFGSIFFVLGFGLVFTLMGVGASGLSGVLSEYKKPILFIGVVFISFMGLHFLGYFQKSILFRKFSLTDKTKFHDHNLLNSFIFGLFFALAWTPCVGPVLGTVLTYVASKTSDVTLGALYLASYSLGVGLPLIIFALLYDKLSHKFRNVNRFLPRIQKITGILLLVFAFSIASTLWKIPDKPTLEKSVSVLLDTNETLIPPLGRNTEFPRTVMFYGDGCPACEAMKPVFKNLKDACKENTVDILKVNVSRDENFNAASFYNIRGIPTFIFFDKSGEEAFRLVGVVEREELQRAITVLFKSTCDAEVDDKKEIIKDIFKKSCDNTLF